MKINVTINVTMTKSALFCNVYCTESWSGLQTMHLHTCAMHLQHVIAFGI